LDAGQAGRGIRRHPMSPAGAPIRPCLDLAHRLGHGRHGALPPPWIDCFCVMRSLGGGGRAGPGGSSHGQGLSQRMEKRPWRAWPAPGCGGESRNHGSACPAFAVRWIACQPRTGVLQKTARVQQSQAGSALAMSGRGPRSVTDHRRTGRDCYVCSDILYLPKYYNYGLIIY
jgi:hypothetical protein